MHALFSSWDIDTAPFDVLDGGDVYCPTCGDAFSPLCDYCPDDDCKLLRPQCASDPLLGAVLDGRFRVMSRLSEGAMGIVYQGVQLSVKRPVAIKVIRSELTRDDSAAQRFLREARLLTKMAHPNIVDVFDYGETEDGCLYLVMELLRGHTLDALLARDGRFTVRRTCAIGLALCDALAAAHSRGVVHRDLKPANVVVLPELGDWVKVLDFGLAKTHDPANEITLTGVVLGTPLYMAPEAIRCAEIDARADLYALGCILFELLTGAPPFAGESSALVLARQLDDAPPPLPQDVSGRLAGLVERLLAKQADDRPPSALAVRNELETCLADELSEDEMLTLTHAALPTVIRVD